MTLDQVMNELERMGTAQNQKVYARHGVGEVMFGVSYANLGKLKKKIKTDHALAEQLWESGNHDARVLATMIADAQALTKRQIDRWMKALNNYVLADALSGLVAQSPHALEKMQEWINAKSEWISSAGWNVFARLSGTDQTLPDAFFESYVKIIEKEIHNRPNRTRYAMNNTLIAIGLRNGNLKKLALAAAGRIGQVQVDHGETGCKTPDAALYIKKTLEHRKRKRAG